MHRIGLRTAHPALRMSRTRVFAPLFSFRGARVRILILLMVCGTVSAAGCVAQPAAPAVVSPSQAVASAGPPKPAPHLAPGEDWTTLPVDRAVLRPLLPGVSLGHEDKMTFSLELIRMEWRHGDFIDIYLVKPHSVPKPHPVLYLYSFPADDERFKDDGWCTRVTRDGLAAVGFVSALTGPRFRNRPMKEWFISELQESLGTSAHDVQLILDYLASRGDLDMDKVGMWAQGSGASIAILAASADPRITALDLLNPWGDWPDWLKTSPEVPDTERPRYITPEFLEKVSMLDPVAYLPKLKDRALRLQEIDDDADTPAAARQKIAAAVPATHLVEYKDRDAHRDAWRAAGISGWIAAHLQPSAADAATATVKTQ